ncbi:MAG TPA: PDZ domain-containing protein [Planctomycetota bacterium]|nr:PDZ domain-containing protein [Planctomycetota bacterium]
MPHRNTHSPHRFPSLLLGLCLGFTSNFALVHAAQPTPGVKPSDALRARELVRALGSDDYSERLSARNELTELGRAAIEPLELAIKSEDPEVRLRALEILIALRGRGFLGISLSETTEDDEVAQGDDEGNPELPSTVQPPKVVANQVVNFRQYLAYGVTKPLPAEAAGLVAGDKILAVNEQPVHGVKDLMREVIAIGPARTALLLIERGDQKLRLPVLLTRNPIMMKLNEFGGMQITKDPPPPVDLEKELELPGGEKQTLAPLAGEQTPVAARGAREPAILDNEEAADVLNILQRLTAQ